MGKYDKVIDKLQRIWNTEPSQQEKLEAVKAEIIKDIREETGMPPSAVRLAREWADLRLVRDGLEKQISDIDAQLDAYAQLMVDQYEAEGVDRISLDTGEAPNVHWEPFARVDDPLKFIAWCEKNGYKSQLTLPWQTRNKIAKDLLLAGEGQPDGLGIYSIPKVKIR